ncbi:nucleotidyltransferase family protein [Faecalibacterium duncaniae]|uniref:nucleotidyltransferase family protein n=1 Tax=Faecalibacterium duncaniae (strain DSM 17677 / JCM 31915 / A2-165) TaxID=411483 RepID=UPI0029408771|nr:nucleotidyltransferase family protein [Faecalibacterium duncaniae]MDV5049676.1 nucleotidyltransferase family protein [Faecalibacterium duncaniae]
MNDINFTMYKLAGIIAEYDPFHNGHAWQLQQAKALGAQRVAVAMSCGLTQRGALPLLPESVRVQAALTCRADLVFALPAPYACSGAECFARAGVQLLAAAGCDALVFGAETPDAALLMEAARVLSGAEYRTALKARLAAGARSFAAARQAAVEAVCPGTGLAALLDKPNNNLAVEYCKAILELGASLVPIPLPRQGAGHGQALTETGGQFASASALRTLWQSGGADAAAPYVPAEVLPLYQEAFAAGRYTDLAAAQRCQLALLRSRCAGTAPFAQVRGISEGLEHRLEAAVRSSTTHAELLDSLTTVRYPRARMRRLAMDAALDYSVDAFPALPPYLHLLGAQKDALFLLKAAALPVSHSLARLAEQNVPCRAVVDAQLRACDFGALCRKKPEPMGGALRQKIIFLTK